MNTEQLHANRRCPYGGGRRDCPCDGNCSWLTPAPPLRDRDAGSLISGLAVLMFLAAAYMVLS